MPYQLPEYLNGKSTKSRALSDYLGAKEQAKLLGVFNQLVGTAKKIKPLFFNNVSEFADKSDDDISEYHETLQKQRALLDEAQEIADTFRVKIAPLSKSKDASIKEVGVNTIKGLDELDKGLSSMQERIDSAASNIAMERARRSGLTKLKFIDVLKNKKLSDAFAAFAKRSYCGDEYSYLTIYAKKKVPKTLSEADDQWKLAVDCNPTSEMKYWFEDISTILNALKIQPNKSLKACLAEIDDDNLREIEMSADDIWNGWVEHWEAAYRNVYNMLLRSGFPEFCTSAEARDALR